VGAQIPGPGAKHSLWPVDGAHGQLPGGQASGPALLTVLPVYVSQLMLVPYSRPWLILYMARTFTHLKIKQARGECPWQNGHEGLFPSDGQTDERTDLPSDFVVSGSTFPSSDIFGISPQGHGVEGPTGKIRPHWAQDDEEQGFGRFLHTKRGLQESPSTQL
jgi:hypothetical protein